MLAFSSESSPTEIILWALCKSGLCLVEMYSQGWCSRVKGIKAWWLLHYLGSGRFKLHHRSQLTRVSKSCRSVCALITALLMFCPESSQSFEHLLCDPLPYQTRNYLERFLGEYRQDIRLLKGMIGWESWHLKKQTLLKCFSISQ